MKNKYLNYIRLISISIFVLGCIHLGAAPIVSGMLNMADAEQKRVFLFMYLAAGLGTILPGLIVLLILPEIRNNNAYAVKTARVCAFYTLALGTGAVITMWDNPFAYAALLLGALLVILLFINKPEKVK